MGLNRPSQLFCALAVLAFAACSTPVAEPSDGGSGSTSGGATTGGQSTGGTSDGSSGGSTGAVGSSGGTTAGSGSGTGGSTGGTAGSGGNTTGGGTGTTGGGTGTGTTGGSGLGTTCLIQGTSDPCSSYGLVCRPTTVPGEFGWVCQLPSEFEGPCFALVGCSSADLHCLPVAGPICVRTCQASSDCPTLWTSCQTFGANQVCYYDLCTTSTSGTFGVCDSAGVGDGTCLPEYNAGGMGLCLGGGTAVAGAECQDHRTPTTTSSDLCGVGQQCLPFGQPPVGHCTPLCGLDAGPTCPSPTFCVPSGQGDWGYCL